MKIVPSLILNLILLIPTCPTYGDEEVRTWTSTDGKTMEMKAKHCDGIYVYLRSGDGEKSGRLALKALSKEDQIYAYRNVRFKPDLSRSRGIDIGLNIGIGNWSYVNEVFEGIELHPKAMEVRAQILRAKNVEGAQRKIRAGLESLMEKRKAAEAKLKDADTPADTVDTPSEKGDVAPKELEKPVPAPVP